MKNVIELLAASNTPAFSFEILPPIKGNGVESLFEGIDKLMDFQPKYINITTHRSEFIYTPVEQGLYKRNRLRRRPGTVAVAAALKNRYNITVVPHLVCSGHTKEDIEYTLIDLQYLGITDLLVLRGDKAKHENIFIPEEGGYAHAIELQEQVNLFNKGFFIDGTEMKQNGSHFSYGVACYPEKHEEAPNMESDLYWLKRKVEQGAQYAVTQLFYDNNRYFEFVKRARQEGITIPIIPGIKPFSKKSQLNVLPKTFKVDLPADLVKEVNLCENETEVKQVGIEWCIAQCKELMAGGVPSIHFYSIGNVDSIKEVAAHIY